MRGLVPKVTIPTQQQTDQLQISPDHVRISMAAAITLGLKPGRVYRDAHCDCINLIENYPEGCFANCSYCGLARERPGVPEDNTFIRVAWPLYSTDLLAEKIAEREVHGPIGRVCVSQVQDNRANQDLIDIILRVRRSAPKVPISALAMATALNEDWLYKIKETGVDIIGFGLDAATEELFVQNRGKNARSPHDWKQHWQIIRSARGIFGAFNVNCHIIVGLGETDRDLVNLFYQLKSEEIAGYLFCFNPEPGSVMQNMLRPSLRRWRRVQLVKYLIEQYHLPRKVIEFDSQNQISAIHVWQEIIDVATNSGLAFMTNGCPNREKRLACNRPYGSYRPGEEFRDYPFMPNEEDLMTIREQLQLKHAEA